MAMTKLFRLLPAVCSKLFVFNNCNSGLWRLFMLYPCDILLTYKKQILIYKKDQVSQ